MILKHWVKSNFNRIYNGFQIPDSESLHVVGTCGNCRHWQVPEDGPYTQWCDKQEADQTCTEWARGNDEAH